MVIGEVTFLENGSQLELVRGYLVMAGLYGDAEPQSLYLEVFHEFHDTGRDGAEVMILQLLVLGAFMSHQGSAGHQQIGTCGVQALVY